jgi:hypothetical protein
MSRVVLFVDAAFLLVMGIGSYVFDRLSYTSGAGVFGNALHNQPYVLGFVEAALLIAVIGAGFLLAGLSRPAVAWHVFAILVHAALMSVDLGYQDLMTTLGISAGFAPVIATVHVVLIIGHLVAAVRTPRPSGSRSNGPARPGESARPAA